MTKDAALDLFEKIERIREHGEAEVLAMPTFDVRLDAYTLRENEQRDYRVRVKARPWTTTDDWQLVVGWAVDSDGVAMFVQNDAIEFL